MEFNYQKAYCVQALPAFNNLNQNQKTAFSELHKIVGDRNQNRALNIPTCEKTDEALKALSCLEIAELSRAVYFVGHWQPSYIDRPFFNKRGESWKIANVCDQELRKRLLPCRSLEIHEGKLRVTFSSRNCWLWEEFALATEKNIQLFKESSLSFSENTLQTSAKTLSDRANDLWQDVNTLPANKIYNSFLAKQKTAKLREEKEKHERRLSDLKQAVLTAEKELKAFTWMINAGIKTENCIYYRHKDVFAFGWKTPIPESEKSTLIASMAQFPYIFEIK